MNLDETPSWASVKNWVEKCGYNIYNEDRKSMESDEPEASKDHALIVDESILTGGDKLLLVLGLKANKDTEEPLKTNQVRVLDMKVRRSSWTAENIEEELRDTIQTTGKDPAYIVSDNASTITKAIKSLGGIHIRDVAHTMALCVERQYKKEEDFKSFIREISEVKCRENMRPYAHLLPPGQRKDSRFMNLSGTIDWAMKMFSNFRKLGKEGKEIFSFLNKYQFMINELSLVFDVSQKILTLFRHQGLSQKGIDFVVDVLFPYRTCIPRSNWIIVLLTITGRPVTGNTYQRAAFRQTII